MSRRWAFAFMVACIGLGAWMWIEMFDPSSRSRGWQVWVFAGAMAMVGWGLILAGPPRWRRRAGLPMAAMTAGLIPAAWFFSRGLP